MQTIMDNTDILIKVSEDIGLEVNSEKTSQRDAVQIQNVTKIKGTPHILSRG